MARTLYLICYDIANPRRLRQICRFLQGYRVEGQRSVFECWLTRSDLLNVRQKLQQLMTPAEDRIHILQLDPRQPVQCFGQAKHFTGSAFYVV